DHRAPVLLLLVRELDHVDLALESDQPARERERTAPLSRAGLGREPRPPFLLVVESLGDRSVRLVAPGRTDALVLVEDARARADRLLEPRRAEEGRRTPEAVDLQHLVGDGDLRVLAHLLADELHREERREIVRPDRLPGARMQHRLQRRGHVGADVVPTPRELRFVEEELGLARGAGARLLHAASIERQPSRCTRSGQGEPPATGPPVRRSEPPQPLPAPRVRTDQPYPWELARRPPLRTPHPHRASRARAALPPGSRACHGFPPTTQRPGRTPHRRSAGLPRRSTAACARKPPRRRGGADPDRRWG